MELNQFVSYNEVFKPEADFAKPLDYLLGIDKDILIKLSVVILYSKFHTEKAFETIQRFLSSNDTIVVQDVINRVIYYATISNLDPNKLSILYPETSLILINTVLEIKDNNVNAEISIKESEIRLLKAYLLINQIQADTQGKISETIPSYDTLNNKMLYLLFTSAFCQSEFLNSDIVSSFCSQFYRIHLLFKMIENDDKTKGIIEKFYENWGINSWKEYVAEIFQLSAMALKNREDGKHVKIKLEHNDRYQFGKHFLELLKVSEENDNDSDFKMIRNAPLYKDIDDQDMYWIIYPLFLVDKIFYSVYFELKQINDSLNKNEKKIQNFRQFITDNFSEQTVLYTALQSIINKDNKVISFNGNTIKTEFGYEAEPDYYIRKDKSIFLFESKDNLYTGEIKRSYNYTKIEEKIKGNLYSKKGIRQLLYNIKKILNREFSFDNAYLGNDISIYPILIYHNRQIDVPGLNNIINEWFLLEVEKLKVEGFSVDRIMPITLINIETIIYFQDQINNVTVLKSLIDKFHKKIFSTNPIIANFEAEYQKKLLNRMD